MTSYSGRDFWESHKPPWPVVPLRRVARLGTGHTPSRSIPEYWEDCTIPWVTTEDLTSREGSALRPLLHTRQQISQLGLANSAAELHPAETVMLCRTASIGHVVRVGKPMATTQAFVTWTCKPSLNPRYLTAVLTAMNPEFHRLAYGSTHLTIYMPDVEQLRVPVPPVPTQLAIADFLDTEIARIDALISKKHRLINLAKLRLLVLANDITRSGSLVAARRLLGGVKTGTTPGGDDAALIREDGDVEWVSPSDVAGGLRLLPAARSVDARALHRGVLPTFPAGSVLVVGVGATAGRVAFLDREVTGNQQMTCLVPNRLMDARFLAWQLYARSDELRGTAPYSTLPILNNDFLRSLYLYVPDIQEQRERVVALDAHLSRESKLERLMTKQIMLLQEHRQALITAAITGKCQYRRWPRE